MNLGIGDGGDHLSCKVVGHRKSWMLYESCSSYWAMPEIPLLEFHSFSRVSYLYRLQYYFEKPREAMILHPRKKHVNIDPQCFAPFATKEIPFPHLHRMYKQSLCLSFILIFQAQINSHFSGNMQNFCKDVNFSIQRKGSL